MSRIENNKREYSLLLFLYWSNKSQSLTIAANSVLLVALTTEAKLEIVAHTTYESHSCTRSAFFNLQVVTLCTSMKS